MIAILGGGIAGASLALSLAARGRRDVVVFDPAAPASGSTGKAFGGFRTQHGSALNIALSLAARPFFLARADRIGFRSVGYLYFATTEESRRALRERAELQRSCGLPIEHPDPASVVPFLVAPDVLEANYCALDGVYLPRDVLACVAEEARERGAELRYGAAAADNELARAETIVICAGAASRQVGQRLGVELGVQPVRRGIFQVGPFPWLSPFTPVTLDAGTGFHFRERDHRLLVVGPAAPEDWAAHREWLGERVPQAATAAPETQWSGDYEVTFDHHPLVGPTERPDVWAMCGFSGHGVMHSPAAADALAAMLLGDTPPIDITPLDPRRTVPLVDTTQL